MPDKLSRPVFGERAVLRTVLAPHVQSAERGGALAECPASWLIRSHDIRQGFEDWIDGSTSPRPRVHKCSSPAVMDRMPSDGIIA